MEKQNVDSDESINSQQITSQSQALGIILNAIEVAQRRGAFNLDEAELLSRARKLFIKADQSTTDLKQQSEEDVVDDVNE